MIRIFCDFDGTVCTEDAGAKFFKAFAGEKANGFTEESLPGKLSMQDWMTKLCSAIPSINRIEFNEYFKQFKIDPYFKEFLHFTEEREIKATILSDGLDAYIEQVLVNSGLGQVPFFANRTEFVRRDNKDRITISFPHSDAECKLCGNCKRNLMLYSSADEDIVVYVGDGFSDRCPAQYADFVFAKGELIKYCQRQNITYFEFNDFGYIQSKLEEILKRKRIRHRQEAAMARRRVFLQE